MYNEVLASIMKPLMERILSQTGGNQLKAAQMLGINRNTLHAKIKKFNIDVRKYRR